MLKPTIASIGYIELTSQFITHLYFPGTGSRTKPPLYGAACFSVNFENYTGGAHGAHAYNHFVLDAKSGMRLTEEDIFVESYQDNLAEILVAQIAKQNNVSDPKELENMGFFSVDEIYPNNNFFVDETGFTYTFNEYEIAAYVVGPIHVHLPFEAVQFLLKPEGPVAQLANLK